MRKSYLTLIKEIKMGISDSFVQLNTKLENVIRKKYPYINDDDLSDMIDDCIEKMLKCYNKNNNNKNNIIHTNNLVYRYIDNYYNKKHDKMVLLGDDVYTIVDNRNKFINKLNSICVKTALEVVSERERLILDLLYNKELSYNEVAKIIGVSNGRIHSIVCRALRIMRYHGRCDGFLNFAHVDQYDEYCDSFVNCKGERFIQILPQNETYINKLRKEKREKAKKAIMQYEELKKKAKKARMEEEIKKKAREKLEYDIKTKFNIKPPSKFDVKPFDYNYLEKMYIELIKAKTEDDKNKLRSECLSAIENILENYIYKSYVKTMMSDMKFVMALLTQIIATCPNNHRYKDIYDALMDVSSSDERIDKLRKILMDLS